MGANASAGQGCVVQAGANCETAKKTEPQMETVITAIAATNAQTSLLRLSDNSANRVSTAANCSLTAVELLADLRELLPDCRELFPDLRELLFDRRELDIHLGVECDERALCLDLKVCQITFRGQLLPSSRWLLCHKELRSLLTYRVGKTAVDFGSLLLCQGHFGLPSNSLWSSQGGKWLTDITVSSKPTRNNLIQTPQEPTHRCSKPTVIGRLPATGLIPRALSNSLVEPSRGFGHRDDSSVQ